MYDSKALFSRTVLYKVFRIEAYGKSAKNVKYSKTTLNRLSFSIGHISVDIVVSISFFFYLALGFSEINGRFSS